MTMAGEAYRAVFLRIHPTGKMVLSLTTEPDGKEGAYADLVARELGVPPLDVKVVPADTDRFGTGHGYNTNPSDGTATAVVSTAGKILEKARLIAGADLQAPAEGLTWKDGRFHTDDGQSTTIADVALYSYGSGELPSGVEGGLDAQTVYRD
jgi:aerobic carbon-monoxide dehydrogenase large subunit